jgi:hypothetical protein
MTVLNDLDLSCRSATSFAWAARAAEGEQAAERLSDAFYTTKHDGMGIGLPLCRSIIEGHRGRFWATPNDGPGATFSFSIPSGVPPVASGDLRRGEATI